MIYYNLEDLDTDELYAYLTINEVVEIFNKVGIKKLYKQAKVKWVDKINKYYVYDPYNDDSWYDSVEEMLHEMLNCVMSDHMVIELFNEKMYNLTFCEYVPPTRQNTLPTPNEEYMNDTYIVNSNKKKCSII